MKKDESGLPSASEAVAAFERWAYGEGWTAGLDEGRHRGFDEGYLVGFDAGTDVAQGQLLAALRTALGGCLHQRLPWLSHLERYLPQGGRSTDLEKASRSQRTGDGPSGSSP